MRRGALVFASVLVALAAGCASAAPPSPSRTGTAKATTASSNHPYVIGPEDVLSISVWKEEGLTRQVRVRPDGRISFPLVGEVVAAGMTAERLREELSHGLQKYITAPAVGVTVDEINSYKVYVLGEVERPGLLPAKAPISVLQALALAGGLKPFADRSGIVLVRQIEGQTYRLRVDYADLVLGRTGAADLVLESGDTLVVP